MQWAAPTAGIKVRYLQIKNESKRDQTLEMFFEFQ